MGCALAIVFQVHPLYVPYGAYFRESLVIRLCTEIGQIHLSIEAQCDHLFYQWVTTTLIVLIHS